MLNLHLLNSLLTLFRKTAKMADMISLIYPIHNVGDTEA